MKPLALACVFFGLVLLVQASVSSRILHVRDFGAKGDGMTDDTGALQRAMDEAEGSGSTVLIPRGVFLVDAALRHGSGIYGLRVRSQMTLRMESGAVLKAIPNGQEIYAILMLADAHDITIIGGMLQGERDRHSGKSGEWGMGIFMKRAVNVRVEGVIARDCWGDGFYISDSFDVAIDGVSADNNRRQGMSIISGARIYVTASSFINTHGTLPEAGIDVEPNEGDTLRDVSISGCLCSDNGAWGIQVGVPIAHTGKSLIDGVIVEGNVVRSNGSGIDTAGGIEVSNARNVVVRGNLAESNSGSGITVRGWASGTMLTDNRVVGNGGFGMELYQVRGGSASGNILLDNRAGEISMNETDGFEIR